MKNSLRIHKWTHNEFNIFILGVLTHPLTFYDSFVWNLIHWLDHLLDKVTLIFVQLVLSIELFVYVGNALIPVDV